MNSDFVAVEWDGQRNSRQLLYQLASLLPIALHFTISPDEFVGTDGTCGKYKIMSLAFVFSSA